MADNDTLVALHTALIDACEGYDEAIKDTEKPSLKALFQRAKLLHEEAHTEIHAILSAKSATPNDKGSLMATVHKTVISMRSATVGLDEGSLSSFASGEERIIEAYDKAIDANGDEGPVRTVLEKQKSALIELVVDIGLRPLK